MNLLGPMMQMTNAATTQAVDIGKQRLREFLENSETARQALAMSDKQGASDPIRLDALDGAGKRREEATQDDDI